MTGQTIEIQPGFSAYLARPAGTPKAGVVVLQEIFGVNVSMRAAADWLASEGYAAIVPDLFWRQQPGVELDPANPSDRDVATRLMQGVDLASALDDAAAAATFIRGAVKTSFVGAIGYCFGGKLAFLSATGSAIDVAISYYGVAIQSSLDRVADLRVPLLLHIAAEDHLCPPEAQVQIRAAMAGRPGLVSIMDHPGVGHAFARRGAPSLDPGAAAQADAATLTFLDRARA